GLERLLRRLAKRAFPAGRAPEPEARAAMRLDGEGRVVEGRQLGKDARDLKRSGQAEPRPRRSVQPRDVPVHEADDAVVGAKISRELPDERGLARAVGADDRVRLAGDYLEVDPIAGLQAAEALAERPHLQNGPSQRGLPPGGRTGPASRTARPGSGSARG